MSRIICNKSKLNNNLPPGKSKLNMTDNDNKISTIIKNEKQSAEFNHQRSIDLKSQSNTVTLPSAISSNILNKSTIPTAAVATPTPIIMNNSEQSQIQTNLKPTDLILEALLKNQAKQPAQPSVPILGNTGLANLLLGWQTLAPFLPQQQNQALKNPMLLACLNQLLTATSPSSNGLDGLDTAAVNALLSNNTNQQFNMAKSSDQLIESKLEPTTALESKNGENSKINGQPASSSSVATNSNGHNEENEPLDLSNRKLGNDKNEKTVNLVYSALLNNSRPVSNIDLKQHSMLNETINENLNGVNGSSGLQKLMNAAALDNSRFGDLVDSSTSSSSLGNLLFGKNGQINNGLLGSNNKISKLLNIVPNMDFKQPDASFKKNK